MDNRPSNELIKSLRTVLQKLEENFASPEDQPQIVELKRILLLRIADVEFVEAIAERDKANDANSIMALALNEDGSNPALAAREPSEASSVGIRVETLVLRASSLWR